MGAYGAFFLVLLLNDEKPTNKNSLVTHFFLNGWGKKNGDGREHWMLLWHFKKVLLHLLELEPDRTSLRIGFINKSFYKEEGFVQCKLYRFIFYFYFLQWVFVTHTYKKNKNKKQQPILERVETCNASMPFFIRHTKYPNMYGHLLRKRHFVIVVLFLLLSFF